MLALARIDACFAAWTNVMVGPLHLIRVRRRTHSKEAYRTRITIRRRPLLNDLASIKHEHRVGNVGGKSYDRDADAVGLTTLDCLHS
jgi:hypothetical protein